MYGIFQCQNRETSVNVLLGKGYGLVVLDESSAKAIFTGIGLQDEGLCAVIINQSGPEKHVANPGLQAMNCLICACFPVPICYLLPEEGSFTYKAREEGLQVVN